MGQCKRMGFNMLGLEQLIDIVKTRLSTIYFTLREVASFPTPGYLYHRTMLVYTHSRFDTYVVSLPSIQYCVDGD